MTKRKHEEIDRDDPGITAPDDNTEPSEAPVEQTQRDPLEVVVEEWVSNLVAKTPTVAASRIAAELHAAGIHTQDELAHANVNLVRRVLMAALGADAHSLTGTAARFQMED